MQSPPHLLVWDLIVVVITIDDVDSLVMIGVGLDSLLTSSLGYAAACTKGPGSGELPCGPAIAAPGSCWHSSAGSASLALWQQARRYRQRLKHSLDSNTTPGMNACQAYRSFPLTPPHLRGMCRRPCCR